MAVAMSASVVDVTVVLLVPGLGDDVQAIKAGIMEIADVFAINKADLPGADKLERDIRSNLTLAHRPDGWMPEIIKTVAAENHGVSELLDAISRHVVNRPMRMQSQQVWSLRLREMLRQRLFSCLPLAELDQAAIDVAERRRDPYTVVQEFLDRIHWEDLSAHPAP